MNLSYELRSPTEKDLGWAARLMGASSPWVDLFFSERQCAELLRHPELTVKICYASATSEKVGFLAASPRGISAEPLLEYMCVADHWRGKGVGSFMVDRFEGELHFEAANLYLFVSDLNPRAKALYERLGYKQVGALPDYNLWGQTEYLLRKSRHPKQQAARDAYLADHMTTHLLVKRDRAPTVLIFDLDGVLINSEELYLRSELTSLRALGLGDVSAELLVDECAGLDYRQLVDAVSRRLSVPLPVDTAERLATSSLRHVRDYIDANPGVRSFLRWAGEVRMDYCVATSTRTRLMHEWLKAAALAAYFPKDRRFSSESVLHDKPDPDLMLYAAERMQADPVDCLVIEDSVRGVKAAIAAGMLPIAYSGGRHITQRTRQDLREAGAEAEILHMEELRGLIESWRGWGLG